MSDDKYEKYNRLQAANIADEGSSEAKSGMTPPKPMTEIDPVRFKVDAAYRKQFFAENAPSIQEMTNVIAIVQPESAASAAITPKLKAVSVIIRAFLAQGRKPAEEASNTIGHRVINYLDPEIAESKYFKDKVSHLISNVEYDATEAKNDFSEAYVRKVLIVITAALALTEKWAKPNDRVIYSRFEQLTHAVLIVYQFIEECMFSEDHKLLDFIFRDAERYFAGRLQETDALFPPENRYWYKLGYLHHYAYDTNENDKYNIVEKPSENETMELANAAEEQIRCAKESFKMGRMG